MSEIMRQAAKAGAIRLWRKNNRSWGGVEVLAERKLAFRSAIFIKQIRLAFSGP
ncbi:hypothetical protein HSX11_03460 [Oxalobacteraceae bacterium]|nr:hypothetical protein [Oxalobacteraceae bacterium]